MDEKLVKTILAEKPEKVIVLDRLFENNDPLKTNTTLQMKDAGIELRIKGYINVETIRRIVSTPNTMAQQVVSTIGN